MSVYLMYHQISDESSDRYVVSPQAFRDQLDGLAAAGYEVVSVGHALAQPVARRPRVVMTFDDGSVSDRLVASPFLLEHGFGATFYVVPTCLGRPGFMTEAQVLELMRAGFEIGSHSMTHPYLTDLDSDALEREVAGSKRLLEKILGRAVRHFACPGGRVNRQVQAAARAAGYDSVATSRPGVNRPEDDPYSLARVAMFRYTSLTDFARICRGEGMWGRRLPELVLGAAKRLLGNSSYDRLRRVLLSHR
jgi:peptidoglycan/xylan/chitin deacetylase (PgdA/CDA1 family)